MLNNIMDKEGVVTFFDSRDNKRFGFAELADGTKVFFHDNACVDTNSSRTARRGDRITLALGQGSKGPRAKRWIFHPYVSYPDLCQERLGTTSQVGAYYVGGGRDYPDLSHNIRFEGSAAMYSSLRIHQDDVERFVARVKKWEAAKRANRKNVLFYFSDREVFCSSRWNQPDLPAGFEPRSFQLPFMLTPPSQNLYGLEDGIVTSLVETLGTQFPGLRQIPNPNPEFEPEGSPWRSILI